MIKDFGKLPGAKGRTANGESISQFRFDLPITAGVLVQFSSLFRHDHDGCLCLVRGLTRQWVKSLRSVLHQQSDIAGAKFDCSIEALTSEGYRLTSLVADLHYAPDGPIGTSGRLCCEIRPKIGAKPLFVPNMIGRTGSS